MPSRAKDKPRLTITLTDGQQDAFVPSYTTMDEIKGYVTLTPQVETKIDNIYITFECIVKTHVERVGTASATTARSEGFTPALRLVQPIPETAMPESGRVDPGKTYTFPFEFCVPEGLLPKTCEHTIDNHVVRQAHLQLPPTLGDPMAAVWGKTMMDDMASEGSIVSYSVRVRLISGRDEKTGKHLFIAEENKKVRVVPAVPEHPPLAVLEGKQDDYRLRKEKPLKKGTFQKRIGTLVMESAQPRALQLPPLRCENPCPVTTLATIRLRFDPASPEAQPPRLGSLVTKLKVATFYASKPMRDIPKRSTDFHYSSDNGLYVESVPLSSRCVESATWVKHTPRDNPRREPTPPRDSTLAGSPVVPAPSLATLAPSESYKEGEDYYTTYLVVPITLPGKVEGNTHRKIFVPTFYTCLVARVYALDLTLSCHTPGASVTVPEMHLKLPVQVSAAPNPDARPRISQGEAEAIARRESLHLGHIAPPIPAYTEEAQPTGVGPSTPEDAELTLTREYPDYPGYPPRIRRSDDASEASPVLPPPDYNIQTSGRPNSQTWCSRNHLAMMQA
ncbi:hypothetical protein XANCAGTX0491_009005 [Xanthoria calcicola]